MVNGKKNFFTSSLVAVILIAGIFSLTPKTAYAIPVEDIPASIWRTIKDVISKSGAQIFNNVLRTAINQLAYDYATYLGSGAPGQKPFFEQKSLGDRISEAGDNALGQFIENVSTTGLLGEDQIVPTGNPWRPVVGAPGKKVGNLNLCAPDVFTLSKITLGLTEYERPDYTSTACSFSQLKQNWQSEYDQIASIIDDPNYLQKLSGYFDPGGSDLSVALTLFDAAQEQKIIESKKIEAESSENQGWIRTQNLISGLYIDAPDAKTRAEEQVRALQTGAIGKYTGDVFVDAANIFLNQLALSAFNKLMNSLGSSTSGGSGGPGSQYAQGGGGGTLAIENKLSTIVQARFSDKTDYNILGELISCPNADKPGPTNCVITDAFSTAISKRITVIDAINAGYLNGDYSFGFKGLNNEEPPYNQGYPYRSLVILRKYRILPVGWELAAQFIQKNNKSTNPPVNTQDIKLMDLIRCFDPCDEYHGYNDGTGTINCTPVRPSPPQSWCTGLVDPNWVLEVPKMYCKAQGYGPEVQNSQYINQGKFCANNQTKACVDTCAALETSGTGTVDPSTCCLTDEGACENKTTLSVTRNQSYCADEQSCIKENEDGSCAYYGYCTEEKRRWVFSQDNRNQCQPINNTCQTFTGNNKTVSYLENTLDYGNCGANQVGCAQYATAGVYNVATKAIDWSSSTSFKFLNKNASDCDPDKEGCHQFVRIKDDLDTNLVADASFETSQCISSGGNETFLPNNNNPFIKTALAQVSQGACQLATLPSSGYLPSPNGRWYIRVNSGSVNAGIVNDKSNHGSQSLYIEGSGGLYSKDSSAPTILPTGFAFESDRFYTLAVTVYVTAGKARAGFGSGNSGQLAESTALDSWQTLIISYYRPSVNGATDFYIEGTDASAKFYIDSVKLTVGSAQTSYSSYLGNNVIYEKLLPNYLEEACYENTGLRSAPDNADYRYKDDAPPECFNFARKCNADEVGCESYTAIDSGINVTAKTKPKDFCPASCIGYDVFVEQATNFSAKQSTYFIPTTARTCSAQATGCTAFTNLDKLAEGGEAVEYFSYLRSCIKPDANQCGQFYTWEGSDEAGYQLRVFSLKKNGIEPASTLSPAEENLLCNADIFKKSPSEPGYNYDCREFYDQNGNVSYHLYSRTITCSDDCHPYRREVTTAQECTAGGGTWDATQSRCLYYAIPNEGTSCSATEVNCREYTGNIANNIQIVLNDTFEDAQNPTQDWTGGSQSNTSLNLGGHSLLGTSLSKTIGEIVRRDQSYTISFLAKAAANALINNIRLVNKDNQAADFTISSASVGTDWKLYTFNLDKLNHEVTPFSSGDAGPGTDIGEKLQIVFSSPVYIDNIKLTEVPSRYYLIKDSWVTPDECDQDIVGGYAPRYMLGCSQYRKADNNTVNLHSFSSLCQDSAAGCEQMIDTQNSTDFKKKLYNDTNNNGTCDTGETSCVTVPADEIINVAYDRTKECGSGDKGCSRYGKASTYDNTTTYVDAYKEDDPDTYNTSLCTQAAVGCEAWSAGNSTVYFKDPGNQACEYRLDPGTDRQYDWFKVKVKRCNGSETGALCSADSDCPTPQTCQIVNTDELCSVSAAKTIGLGGRGNQVEQPTSGWAGLCSAEQAGCTEYVDPVSRFNNNIIFNPTYSDLDGNGIDGDGWSGPDQLLGANKVEPNTLYILKGAGALIKNWGNNELYQLDPLTNDFKLVDTSNPFKVVPPDVNGKSNSTEFFVIASGSFNGFTVSGGGPNKTIELRKTIIGYQLKQNIDRSPTTVDFKTGRVLFNERSVNGTSKQKLIYNADQTAIDSSTSNPPSSAGQLNANVILKVAPDRTCDKWLACRSYGVDSDDPSKQTCFDIGLCNSLSPNGECQNFVESVQQANLTLPDGTSPPPALEQANAALFSNMTGYSKVGYQNGLLNADMYNLAVMKQSGSTATVNNGSFENINIANSNWDVRQGQTQITNAIIRKSSDVQPIAYADGTLPDGTAILRLNQSQTATSSIITLSQNTKYIISVYIYNRTGNAKLDLLDAVTGQPITSSPIIDTTGDQTKNKWIRKVGAVTTGALADYKIRLSADKEGTYFDDVRIESSLNNRCGDESQEECEESNKWYVPSSCRLYPKADSLACFYEEEGNNIKQKGWRGYCLEWDPKNPQSCLLWYPVDKIISEGAEEGAGVELPDNLYYCLETEGICPPATVNQLNGNFYIASNPYGNTIGARATNASGGNPFFNKINNEGPDKPVYQCTKVVEVDTNKYWRTRWLPSGGYSVDQKAVDKIHFVPGGDLTVNLIPGTQFGGGETFSSSQMIRYTVAGNVNNDNGVPFTNKNDNLVCTAYLRAKDDIGNNCNYHYTTLGDWETCDCTYGGECAPGESCTGGEFGCNNLPTPYGRICAAVKNGDTWQGITTDQEQDGGSPDYTISRFSCSSPANFTYHGSKATNTYQELLSTIFVKSIASYQLSGSSYTNNGTQLEDILQRAACGHQKKCVNNGNNCVNDSDCPGSTCFTDRPRITNPAGFNYSADYCPIYPKIFNIRMGKFNTTGHCANDNNRACSSSSDCLSNAVCQPGTVSVAVGDYVELKFNSKIDPDQLPLNEYIIDWDGLSDKDIMPTTSLQLCNLYDRPNLNSPHSFKTYFSYQEISSSQDGHLVCNLDQCVLKPSIKIWDNWRSWKEITTSQFPVQIIVTKD